MQQVTTQRYSYNAPPMRGRTIPAWDNLFNKLEKLHHFDAVTDNAERYLLDASILIRMPNAARRCITGIRDFIGKWMNDPAMRTTFVCSLNQRSTLTGVNIRVGKPDPTGAVNISIGTSKGFIVVKFDKEQLI